MRISVPIHAFAVSHEYHSKNGVVYKPYNLLGPETDKYISELIGLIQRSIDKGFFVERRAIVNTFPDGRKLVIGLVPEYGILVLRGINQTGIQDAAVFFELHDIASCINLDDCPWFNVEPGNYYVEKYEFA